VRNTTSRTHLELEVVFLCRLLASSSIGGYSAPMA
jgi:hypothetical protein